MASGDQYAFLQPRDFTATNSGNSPYAQLVKVGSVWGLPLDKKTDQYYVAEFRAVAGVSTGITIQTAVVDDPATSNSDVGKVIRLGISVKILATGSDTYDITTGASAETEFSVTLDATAGEVVLTSTAIAAADVDVLAAGVRALIIIRRVGSSASDTHRGRPVLMGVTIRDT